MKEPKRKPVAVLGHQVKKRAPIIVIGEYRSPIVPTIHEVEATFFGPLQRAWAARQDERLRVFERMVSTAIGAIFHGS